MFVCNPMTYTLRNSNHTYTGGPRRNEPDFGRMFLMLKYTDITQNTYIQSWTFTEIMAREKCGLLAVPLTVPVQLTRYFYSAHVRPWESGTQSRLLLRYERMYRVAKMPFMFSHVEYCEYCVNNSRNVHTWSLEMYMYVDGAYSILRSQHFLSFRLITPCIFLQLIYDI